jgi:hypothetical protein
LAFRTGLFFGPVSPLRAQQPNHAVFGPTVARQFWTPEFFPFPFSSAYSMNAECDIPFGILQRGVCNGNGVCGLNGTCICAPGYSSQSDWYNIPPGNCITHARGLWLCAIVLTTLSVFAGILILFKVGLLYGESKRNRRKYNEPLWITLAMSIPIILIGVYEILLILSPKMFLMDNLALCIVLIIFTFFWELLGFLINRWLLESVAAEHGSNSKILYKLADRVIIASGVSGILIFICNTTLLIALYAVRSPHVYRAYAIIAAFAVLIHAAPYAYATYLERNAQTFIARAEPTSALSDRPPRNIFATKETVLIALIFLYNIIFAIFSEFSPYYVQAQFVSGLFFSLGCYKLFPASTTIPRNSDTLAMSDTYHTGGGHSSALSDTMGTATRAASAVESSS